VSYNTSSDISEEELESLAGAEGWDVAVHRVIYHFPSTKKNGRKQTKEILMVCT
jgi:hypothetical protein